MNSLRPVLLAPLLCLSALSGCSIYSVPGSSTGSVIVQPPPVYEEPEPTLPPTPPAPEPSVPGDAPYAELLHRAGEARDAGQYEQALALLERAQRIDPDSAAIYLDLARTHRASGDQAQARATAERGLLYCNTYSQCDALREFTR